MIDSNSTWLRLATGVPTRMSSWAGVAGEQRLECGEQRHEQGGARAAAHLAELLGESTRDLKIVVRPRRRRSARARMIGRQLERRGASAEVLVPVLLLGREPAAR